MGAFNACPMAIGVLEGLRAFSLARRKKRLHLLFGVQGQRAPSRSCTRRPLGANLTIALGKFHLDERFACILDGSPARTDPALGTGDRLGFPIDGEVCKVVASLRLIPVRLEGRANQVNAIARLRLDEIGTRDIARIDEMVIGEEVLLSQIGMNRGEHSLITEGSRSRLDMRDQLWSVFIAGLGEMHLISDPERGSFLAIPGIQVIGRVDELSCGQRRFWTPLSTLFWWLKLLLPNGV